MLYGEIRVILRENEVKTFHRRVERGRDRERGVERFSCENIPRPRGRRERWRIMAPLRNENCMETTREGRGGRGEREKAVAHFLPSCRQKKLRSKEHGGGIRFRQSHLNFWSGGEIPPVRRKQSPIQTSAFLPHSHPPFSAGRYSHVNGAVVLRNECYDIAAGRG